MRSTLLLIQNISNMNAVPQAVLIGDVTVAEDCYVGAGAVLRCDSLFRYRHRSRKPHPGPYRDTGRECRHGFARGVVKPITPEHLEQIMSGLRIYVELTRRYLKFFHRID
jgi:hypothetical protein